MLSFLFVAILLYASNVSPVDADQERKLFERSVVMPSKEEFKNIMLSAHNDARAALKDEAKSMPMLKWNDGLARNAEIYSMNCVFRHNNYRDPHTGENIYAGSVHGHWNATDAVKSWVDEKEKAHSYEDLKNFSKVGHFTQVIWADTTELGCGFSECNNLFGGYRPGVLVVCNYKPGGNFKGHYPYQRKTTE